MFSGGLATVIVLEVAMVTMIVLIVMKIKRMLFPQQQEDKVLTQNSGDSATRVTKNIHPMMTDETESILRRRN